MIVTPVLVGVGVLAGTFLTWRLPRLGVPTGPSRSVSVIVPARDEEHTLPTLLAGLDSAGCEVIVVDDGSTDATAAVARGHDVTVLTAGEPPPGWLGKPWACQRGAERAIGDVLVFLDADVELAPGAIGALTGELARQGGLVSVQPHHRPVRAYEQLSAYFNAVAVMGVGAFTPIRRIEPAGAFGPCLATSRADYVAVGGHAGVRDRVLEDVHLAHRYRAHGLPVTCRVGGSEVAFRMYPAGIGQLVEGWSKNIALGAAATKPWAAAGAAVWVAAGASAAAAGLVGLARWAAGGGVPWVGIAAWVLVAAHLAWVLRRLGRFRWWASVVFVVPLAAFVTIFARSAVLTLARRRVRWRGRSIPVAGDRSAGAR